VIGDGSAQSKKDGLGRPFASSCLKDICRPGSVQVAEEEKDQDDRKRNPDQPQKPALHHGQPSELY
jgi:hypothetical protein